MFTTGLTSVTFRRLSVADVVKTAAEAGLDGIEWGGDIHVPTGDTAAAKTAAGITADSGLRVLSYGSYFRAEGDNYIDGIKRVAETVNALACKTARIWAGSKDYGETNESFRSAFADRIRECASICGEAGITLCFEHHKGTLANSAEHTLKLLNLIGAPNVKTYWQPLNAAPKDNVKAIGLLGGNTVNAHVFHWSGGERLPLAKGVYRWEKYITALKKANSRASLILEFVRGDEPDFLKEDAMALRAMIKRTEKI